jgi:ElaB protein
MKNVRFPIDDRSTLMNATLDSNHSESAGQDLSGQFHELFDGVEDLIKRVAEVESPEIQKIRAKVRAALIVARSAVQDGAAHVGRKARWAAETTDDYLREYPWYALGLVALLGFGAGLLAARRGD